MAMNNFKALLDEYGAYLIDSISLNGNIYFFLAGREVGPNEIDFVLIALMEDHWIKAHLPASGSSTFWSMALHETHNVRWIKYTDIVEKAIKTSLKHLVKTTPIGPEELFRPGHTIEIVMRLSF